MSDNNKRAKLDDNSHYMIPEQVQDQKERELLYNPIPRTTDEAAFDIISKIPAGSRTKLNQVQIDSFNYVCQFAIQKIVEGSKIWPCRVADDFYVFIFDRVYADKPFRIEQNGIKHNLSIQECFNRQSTYKSPFYVQLSVWMWSQTDPRSTEKRAELVNKKKKIIRIASKLKRVRVEQFEMSSVQNLERKRERGGGGGTIEDRELGADDLKEIRDEDFFGTFGLEDAVYASKRDEGYKACRFNAYEKTNYPFLVSKMTWPKHTLVEIPIMPDTVLCHSLDSIAQNLQCMYTAGGPLILLGLEHPFMRTYKLRFNEAFLFDTAVEIRSAHPVDKLRSSSSTLKLDVTMSQTYNHEYMFWKIPYADHYKVPFAVLFYALDIFDQKKIEKLIKFQLKHYFRKEKYIPMDKAVELIHWSLEHHDRGSELIDTQQKAFIFLGKLSDKQINEDYTLQLIKGPEEESKEELKKKQRTIPKQPSLAKKKREAALAAASAAGIVLPQRHERDQNEVWMNNGFTVMVREILPHVGCNFKRAPTLWKPKALHLAKYAAKCILNKIRRYAVNPVQFLTADMRDTVENRRIQLCAEWIGNNLLRGTLTNHFKMFRRDCIGMLHNDESIEPKTALDHKRPTNIVDSSLATGIIKSRIHPALVASQFKNGKRDFHPPDSHRRPNNNNNSKQAKDRTGITQILNNTNLLSSLSQQVRVNGNLKATGGQSTAREILDHWRVIDFNETPDNKGCGIIFPHSLFSRVSIGPGTDELLTDVVLSNFEIVTLEDIFDDPDQYDHSKPVYFSTEHLEMMEEQKANVLDVQIPSTQYDERLISVNINGRCVGFATPDTVKRMVKFLRSNRYRLMGDSFLSVANRIATRTLDLACDEGRFVSALFVVSKLPKLLSPADPENGDHRPLFMLLTWDQMLREGFVEYVDKEEENNDLFICKTLHDFTRLLWIAKHAHKDEDLSDLPFTHCEIHPVLILGICSSQIPFADANQGPRNVFGANMSKQAIAGVYMNVLVRMDNLQHSLTYSNKALVYSETLRFIAAEDATPGFQAMGAIVAYYGKSVEDALIINAGAAQRGMGRSVQTSVVTLNEMKLNSMNQAACFRKSNRKTTVAMRTQQYSHLDVDGFPFPGEMLTTNHMMISRTRPLEEKIENAQGGELKWYDMSAQTLKKNAGIVRQVMLTSDDKGQRKSRVQTCKLNRLIKSDKVASKHAQKNIIGELKAEEDMPRTSYGLIPMFLFNPHGIPSRMTIAHIMEILGGRVAVAFGKRMNATPLGYQSWKICMDVAESDFEFLYKSGAAIGNVDLSKLENDESRIEVMANALKMKGFKQQYGEETFYNGITGERMGSSGCNERGAGRIFFGPIEMYKLAHLGTDKLHSRSTGLRHALTRQPVEGSKNNGGYKVGAMENTCLNQNTPITLESGVSMQIKHLQHLPRVFTYSLDEKEFIGTKPLAWLPRPNLKQCLQLVFADGRTLECTPDHQILTRENGWIQAKDLVAHKHTIVAGVDAPLYDPEEDAKNCAAFNLKLENLELELKMDTIANVEKCFAFFRILAYVATDGSVSHHKLSTTSQLFMGHNLDADAVVRDINLLTEKVVPIRDPAARNIYGIHIPAKLTRDLVQVGNLIIGKRLHQRAEFPPIVMNENFPLPLLREYLGALYGADGCAPVPTKHSWDSIRFCCSRDQHNFSSLMQYMESLKILLKRFGIENVYVNTPEDITGIHPGGKPKPGIETWRVIISLQTNELLNFADKIGFRYCCHKQQRLAVAASFFRYKNSFINQRLAIMEKIKEITNYDNIQYEPGKKRKQLPVPISTTYRTVVEEFKNQEILIHPKYSIPSYDIVKSCFNGGTTLENTGLKLKISPAQWIAEVGAEEMFNKVQVEEDRKNSVPLSSTGISTTYAVKRGANGLPPFHLKFIGSKEIGEKETYDLSIDKTHNFLANGLTVHNCILVHGASYFLRERHFLVSDPFVTHICTKCGYQVEPNMKDHFYYCRVCNSNENSGKSPIAWSFSLLYKHLIACGIVPRYVSKKI